MRVKITPIAAAVAFSLGGQAHAVGGAAGSNGSPIKLGSSQDISAETITFEGVSTGGFLGGSHGGGGIGGQGGASVIGDLLLGESGGDSNNDFQDGDDAGKIENSRITLSNVTLEGAGGNGGDGGRAGRGGGGAAGHGGGSVFGGISTGGGGGSQSSSNYSFGSSSVNGGTGSSVSGNIIEVTSSSLTGSDGGNGGGVSQSTPSSYGGGGAAGHGGGSVFGGISTGGAGGAATANATSTTASVATSTANGGDGSSLSSNTIKITDSTLLGGEGGGGGSVESFGGGGAAGHGGGSVFGGISTGGAGGYTYTSGGYSPVASASSKGGGGGDVSGNTIEITNSTLIGEGGGAGGSVLTPSISSTTTVSSYGSGGAAGHAGGAVFGGISTGGAGGYASSSLSNSALTVPVGNISIGGNGGKVFDNRIRLKTVQLNGNGATAGTGGSVASSNSYLARGGGGAGGHGGGSVFGGVSTGGAGGDSNGSHVGAEGADGGDGGSVSGNIIEIIDSTLKGGAGGDGGSVIATRYSVTYGGGGAAGHGGGSVFGGISTGGAGGIAVFSSANGGEGGSVTGNTIDIIDATLIGAGGGMGGSVSTLSTGRSYGGEGAAGHGGGSVFGGISTGGAGGAAEPFSGNGLSSGSFSANGGAGGSVSGNTIEITNSILIGAGGGFGGSGSSSAMVSSLGGGSVFGGVSIGGAGGSSGNLSGNSSTSGSFFAKGGAGGSVSGNKITLNSVELDGSGAVGQGGGSVFGGISMGGAGGYSESSTDFFPNGGDGGDVFKNEITISGQTKISGDIYGGLSQGGASIDPASFRPLFGFGGNVNDNIITLIGEGITIGGSIYGGKSIDGDGNDSFQKNSFNGNTLKLVAYKGSVKGIYNINNFDWILPLGVSNQDSLKVINGNDDVSVWNTKHSVAMYNDGNQLNVGDQIYMIKNKVIGKSTLTTPQVRQGLFLVYDISLETIDDDLVLSILAKDDQTPNPPIPEPGGDLHPTSKSYLQGRTSTLATLNQGADMVSDYMANVPAENCRTNIFGLLNGGSNRYDTGSHIKVHDLSMVIGAVKCVELQSKKSMMLGAFIQKGHSNYDSYNSFGSDGDVHGWGKVHYMGAGLVFHMNMADIGLGAGNEFKNTNAFGNKNGFYLNASVSFGKAKTNFNSDIVDFEGVRGQYESKSNYATAMAGAGYAWKIDHKQLLDFYGRYSWTSLSSDSVLMGKDQLHLGSMHSSRVRMGARYSYEVQANALSYVGLGYEHEFHGHASGTAYNMAIDRASLKGGRGLVEVGINFKPTAIKQDWTVNVGLQGHFGQRKGVSGGVKLRYDF